jgi:hypothetical protein
MTDDNFFCPKCERFMFFPHSHQCPPLFYCLLAHHWEDEPDISLCSKIYHSTPEIAAKNYAENLAFQGKLPSGDFEVVVIDQHLTEIIYFSLEVVPVPSAEATEKKRLPYQPAEETEEEADYNPF